MGMVNKQMLNTFFFFFWNNSVLDGTQWLLAFLFPSENLCNWILFAENFAVILSLNFSGLGTEFG